MAIISIFSGSYCRGEEITASVVEKLNYQILDEQLLSETSTRYGIPKDRLIQSILGTLSPFRRLGREREKNVALLRIVLAEMIQADNLVIPGFAGHLIPRTIAHLLKVCIIANFDFRVDQLVKTQGISEKNAAKILRKEDREKLQWTQYLFTKSAYDEDLYDIVIPTHGQTEDLAVNLIVEHAKSDAVKTTTRSKKAAEDFLLAAKVKLELAKSGHDMDTYAEEGVVTIIINQYVVRLEKLEEELKGIAQKVDGVKQVITRTGRKYSPPSIISLGELEMPSKILLVDDEKEFVQTLSERLLTRNLESSVVYDGEQALEYIKEDEPEVMVLDLKMPGIDGIEVLRRVKRDHPYVEVIILTGHGSEKEEAIANELGAFAYLQKPVNVDHLAQVMKAAYKKISETKSKLDNPE